MTKAFELQQWLRKNGAATAAEIKAAGFVNFSGLTRKRMIAFGALEAYEGPNPHSAAKHARVVTTFYQATDVDYLPHRGAKKGSSVSPAVKEASVVARAVSVLEKRGYVVTPPAAPVSVTLENPTGVAA